MLDREDRHSSRVCGREFATNMEVAGASLTLFRLDDELIPLLDHPAQSPLLRAGVSEDFRWKQLKHPIL